MESNDSYSSISVGIVIIVISCYITVLGGVLIPFSLPNKEFLINFPLVIFFVIINYNRKFVVDRKFLRNFTILCAPVGFGYLIEGLRYLINGGDYSVFNTYILIGNLLVAFTLISLLVHVPANYLKLLKFYYYLNVFIAISAFCIFIFLVTGFINLENWPLPSFYGSAFQRKIDFYSGSFSYYSPFFITIIASYSREVGMIGSFGAFTGLSYEPHIAGFFMGPAFFMSSFFLANKKTITKVAVYTAFILFFLLATSVTNLVTILVVVAVWFIVSNINSIRRLLIGVVSSLLALGSILYFFWDYIQLLLAFAEYKLSSRSRDESEGFISYILSPKSYFGDGIFNIPLDTVQTNALDIGIIGTVVFVMLYLILFGGSGLLILRLKYRWMGLALLYFTIHSLKFPFHVIRYPFLIFMISIIAFSLQGYNKKGKYVSN